MPVFSDNKGTGEHRGCFCAHARGYSFISFAITPLGPAYGVERVINVQMLLDMNVYM